jgi:hypothetical protein
MKVLIVTDTHKNCGDEVDVNFTEQRHFYSDDQGRMYTMNDFVDVDSIDYELAKARKLIEYWTVVSRTIEGFKKNEVQE